MHASPLNTATLRSWPTKCVVQICIAQLAVCVSTSLAASPEENGPKRDDDVARLAQRIDAEIAAAWRQIDVQPSEPADDAEFLRRTYLNLVGRVPRVSEVLDFLDDQSPHKRREVVERLLASPGYAINFTNVWRSVMIPEANSNRQVRSLTPIFEVWLHRQLSDNAPYDEIVRKLVSAPLANNGQVNLQSNIDAGGPMAFYRAKQFKPEELASATSRLFLGIRLECAQCHDHPFADWRREQFWRFAAFFGGISGDPNGRFRDESTRSELQIPGTDRVVQAGFPMGDTGSVPEGELPRRVLAEWLTSPENHYFSRSAVNRIWAHLFGTGIVDPVDDFDPSNPPSHPALLDELARQFVAHKYDLKVLIQAITASRTYQLSSRQTHESQHEEQLFARYAVRAMSARQLFESLRIATGLYERPELRIRFRGISPQRSTIENLFAAQSEDASRRQTSILQALELMNGMLVASRTNRNGAGTLFAVTEAPFYDTVERIELLYLATLNRRPSADELTRLVAHVESMAASNDSVSDPVEPKDAGNHDRSQNSGEGAAGALSDIFWALLNSSEFHSIH